MLVLEGSYLFLIWLDNVLFDLHKSFADVLDVRLCLTPGISLELVQRLTDPSDFDENPLSIY